MKFKGMHYSVNVNPYVNAGKFSVSLHTQNGLVYLEGFNSFDAAQTAAHTEIVAIRSRQHATK